MLNHCLLLKYSVLAVRDHSNRTRLIYIAKGWHERQLLTGFYSQTGTIRNQTRMQLHVLSHSFYFKLLYRETSNSLSCFDPPHQHLTPFFHLSCSNWFIIFLMKWKPCGAAKSSMLFEGQLCLWGTLITTRRLEAAFTLKFDCSTEMEAIFDSTSRGSSRIFTARLVFPT